MGSSPLARGLLDLGVQGGQAARIIPARAGFTHRGGLDRVACQDHPRSRGVYGDWIATAADAAGSSPLARGLLRVDLPEPGLHRIIPARAGFTSGPVADRRPSGDHPRSRGVYVVSCGAAAWMMGSSPLARGLPTMALAWAALLRIIPARAGFTGRDNLVQRPAQDHPRSRGVYAAEAALADEAEGSSPLARGLHHPSRAAAMRARIIPARAGFTRPSMRIRPRSWDHPRSRGVYTTRAGRRR